MHMEAWAAEYLRYIHLSLADAARLVPSLAEDCVVEVTHEELERGSIGEHARKQLFARVKRSAGGAFGSKENEGRLWPIDVVVMPGVYGLRLERGQRGKRLPEKVVPLMLFAKLGKDGSLMPEDARLRMPAKRLAGWLRWSPLSLRRAGGSRPRWMTLRRGCIARCCWSIGLGWWSALSTGSLRFDSRRVNGLVTSRPCATTATKPLK